LVNVAASALGFGSVETIVGGRLFGGLLHALDRVELRRVRRQSKQLDTMCVANEPTCASLIEVITGSVIDHEKHSASTARSQRDEELVKPRARAIHKTKKKLERDSSENVCRLALIKRVNSRKSPVGPKGAA
jgi:hypothetical protein